MTSKQRLTLISSNDGLHKQFSLVLHALNYHQCFSFQRLAKSVTIDSKQISASVGLISGSTPFICPKVKAYLFLSSE